MHMCYKMTIYHSGKWAIRVNINFIYLYKLALSWSCNQYYIGGKNSKIIDYTTTMHMHCVLYYRDNMFCVIKNPRYIFDVCYANIVNNRNIDPWLWSRNDYVYNYVENTL